jgi:SAM-dependent methyltransferase
MDVQTLWDDRYKRGLPSLEKPDPFFESVYEQHIQRIFPGKGIALDLAAGIGRHSHYLAARNWHTTAVDISPVAIERLVERSKMLGVTVDATLSDAAQYSFQPESFDLIILYYHFDRTLFPKIYGALKPGGVFICKLAVAWSSGQIPPESMALPLQKEELLSLLGSYETMSHFERPVRDRGVVEYLGRKPFLPKNARL